MTAADSSTPAWPASAPPRTVVVIVTRRIGDVLLATPLIRSLKRAWPETTIDALVFQGTEAILEGNPDVRNVLAIPERPAALPHLAFLTRLARRYDLALSLVPGDRPTFYAFISARRRVGLLVDTRKERWKRPFLHRWVPFDGLNTHTVRMHLALAERLGVAIQGDPVVSWREQANAEVNRLLGAERRPCVVLHTYPKFNYKMWSDAGWAQLAAWLDERGYRMVLTGGNAADEGAYVTALLRHMPPGTINAAGRLTLGASAALVARAALYVGPDTALTHVAAALGVPTIALFGPTDPVKWGPWPRGHPPALNPWRRYGSQRMANVTLLQGNLLCTPCLHEGCGKNTASFSECLQQLPASRVIAAIALMLAGQARTGAQADRLCVAPQ